MYKFISFYCVMCAFVILSCTKEQAPDFLGVYPGQNFSDAENVLIKNNFVFQADQVGNFYVGKYEGTEADVQLSYELDKTISSVSVNMLYDKNNVAKRRFNKILRNLESKYINYTKSGPFKSKNFFSEMEITTYYLYKDGVGNIKLEYTKGNDGGSENELSFSAGIKMVFSKFDLSEEYK